MSDSYFGQRRRSDIGLTPTNQINLSSFFNKVPTDNTNQVTVQSYQSLYHSPVKSDIKSATTTTTNNPSDKGQYDKLASAIIQSTVNSPGGGISSEPIVANSNIISDSDSNRNDNGDPHDSGDGVYAVRVSDSHESGRNMSANHRNKFNRSASQPSANKYSERHHSGVSRSISSDPSEYRGSNGDNELIRDRVPLSRLKDVNEGISGSFKDNDTLNVRLQNLKNAHKNDALMEDLDDIFESPTTKRERDEDEWEQATTANVSRESEDVPYSDGSRSSKSTHMDALVNNNR